MKKIFNIFGFILGISLGFCINLEAKEIQSTLEEEAKDSTIFCGEAYNSNELFSNWVQNYGGAVVSGFCGEWIGFAAVPGSYDTLDFNSFPGESVDQLDNIVCPTSIVNVLRYEIVDFVFYDTCNNIIVTSAGFYVKDTLEPEIIHCPNDTLYIIDNEQCDVVVNIQTPNIIDNCTELLPHVSKKLTEILTTTPPGEENIIVNPLSFNFGPFYLESSPVDSDVTLKISLANIDGDHPEERFIVYSETGVTLDTTPNTSNQCADTFLVLTILPSQFNSWLLDGYVNFELIPLTPVIPELGINNACGVSSVTLFLDFDIYLSNDFSYWVKIDDGSIFYPPSFADFDTLLGVGTHEIIYYFKDCAQNETSCSNTIIILDSVSPNITCPYDTIISLPQNSCTYTYTLPNTYDFIDNCTTEAELRFEVEGSTMYSIQDIEGINTNIVLNKGINLIHIYAFDGSGNLDSCSYTVDIIDLERPIVLCKKDTLYLSPFDSLDYTIQTIMFDNGSTDNCGINSMFISPGVIKCDDLNQEIPITLYAVDTSGNIDSCTTNLLVLPISFYPSYTIGFCEEDSLFLYANVDMTSNTFIDWTGPAGFHSNETNPIISNPPDSLKGIYTLEITGANGCSAQGNIDVVFDVLRTPSMISKDDTICEETELTITVDTQSSLVNYIWYELIGGIEIPLDTSMLNTYSLIPTLGSHQYFVKAFNEHCLTASTTTIIIEVIPIPNATVISLIDDHCSGDSLKLFSNMPIDMNFNYQWLGPNNYFSNQQNNIIVDSQVDNSGSYSFIVSKGSCYSDTTVKTINVYATPDKPIISSAFNFCEGSPIQLYINNITNADKYYWIKEDVSIPTEENILEFPNATPNLGGRWKAYVQKDYSGKTCFSDTSYSHEITIEERLEIGISGPDSACIGDTVMFFAPFIPNAIYAWTGPADFTYDQQNPRLLAIEGEYQVLVTTAVGCMNTANQFLHVDEVPKITALSNTADPCMDGKTDIQFSASVFPEDNYQYNWSGPNNYYSNEASPTIINATSSNNGPYILIIKNNYCNSKPDTSLVDIINIPNQPSLFLEEEYCLGSDVVIEVQGELGNDISYVWNTPIGTKTTMEPELLVSIVKLIDAGFYTVLLQRENCKSEKADTVELKIRALPEKPSIISADNICEGESVILEPSVLGFQNYQWMIPSGEIVENEDLLLSNFSEDKAGVYLLRVSDGVCFSEWSEAKFLTLIPKPITSTIAQITDSACFGTDDEIHICLTENTLEPGAVYSYYEAINHNLLATSASNCIDIDNLDLFQTGVNHIYVQSTLNGCTSDLSPFVVFNLDQIPNHKAIITEGDELYFCTDGAVVLNTNPPTGTNVEWYANESYFFSQPNKNTTIVNDLYEGKNQVFLSYSYNSCENYSKDTVKLFLEEDPTAYDDEISINYNESVIIDVLLNDEFTSEVDVFIVEEPIDFVVEIVGGKIIVQPEPEFIGKLLFEYEVCSKYCINKCHTAWVSLQVGDNHDCFAPSIITPNNDGINDAFVVPCLESNIFPNNKLIIINQWGDSVYESSPYNNNWFGTYNNKDLPVGTYFYLLELGNGEVLKGFLMIEK